MYFFFAELHEEEENTTFSSKDRLGMAMHKFWAHTIDIKTSFITLLLYFKLTMLLLISKQRSQRDVIESLC